MSVNLKIQMFRGEKSPWGFRLHGGSDFGTPLSIQKVHDKSISEKVGLRVGDVIVSINGQNVGAFKHKEAQDAILAAGNSFELFIKRGEYNQNHNINNNNNNIKDNNNNNNSSCTWKPIVSPIGPTPLAPTVKGTHFTSTSLAASKPQDETHWDVKHNSKAKGFSTIGNGMRAHQMYNNPSGLYSEDNIKEVLNAHSETLSSGIKGINFKQYEKPSPAMPESSEVLRALHEQEAQKTIGGVASLAEFQENRHSLSSVNSAHNVQSASFKLLQKALESNDNVDGVSPDSNVTGGFRSVTAPVSKPESGSNKGNVNSMSRCAQCDRVISGVFVKAGGKPLHPECFHCTTCNTTLRNVGYFTIGNKLYCEVHARQVKANEFISTSQSNTISQPNSGPSLLSREAKEFQPSFSSSQRSKNDWITTLNNNKSGSALNAQDFTKNFMEQNNGPSCFGEGTQRVSTQKMTQKSSFSTSQVINQSSNDAPDHSKGKKVPVSILKTPGSGSSEFERNSFESPSQNVSAPRRGRGILTHQIPGLKVPVCGACVNHIRGPFITALGKTWCPNHFICYQKGCNTSLQEVGFVEEQGHLYCEECFGKYLAPNCDSCTKKILGNCLKAMNKNFHPECFTCTYCQKIFANSPFYLEDGRPYCEEDWNELFTTKCVSCGFPIEAGDRWVEALNNNYHNQCFNCTLCKKNLEGQGFFVKAGKPFCKSHARFGP